MVGQAKHVNMHIIIDSKILLSGIYPKEYEILESKGPFDFLPPVSLAPRTVTGT